MLTRRQILVGCAFGSWATTQLDGCAKLSDFQPKCSAKWDPNLIDPMHFGYRDYSEKFIRVYFPALPNGRPQFAPILLNCGRYPLVIMVPGDCADDPILSWAPAASQLARAGYVVVAPKFQTSPQLPTDPSEASVYLSILTWMRASWEYASSLLPPPATCLIGHSYGALHCALLAATTPISGYASIDGELAGWQASKDYLSEIAVPTLYAWGTGVQDISITNGIFNIDAPASSPIWINVNKPRNHAVAFLRGQHGDWLSDGATHRCGDTYPGPCGLTPQLIADYLTAFASRCATPEFEFTVSSWVPDSLVVDKSALNNAHLGASSLGTYLAAFRVSTVSTTKPSFAPACMQYTGWNDGTGWHSAWVTQNPG